jgi:hypothetical protein
LVGNSYYLKNSMSNMICLFINLVDLMKQPRNKSFLPEKSN